MNMVENRIQPRDIVRPTSITLIRRDPLRNLPRGIGAKERIGAFIEAVALVASTKPDPDKFRLDATTSQKHARAVIFTQNPVPRGNIVTDHSILRPLVVQFTGIITETPFIPYTFTGEAGGAPTISRVQDQIRRLEQFFEQREPLFMASSIRTVDGMAISSLTIGKSQSTGAAVDVQMTLQQILFVDAIRDQAVPDTQADQLGASPHVVATSGA